MGAIVQCQDGLNWVFDHVLPECHTPIDKELRQFGCSLRQSSFTNGSLHVVQPTTEPGHGHAEALMSKSD
jgi:hypothetical protein